MKKEQESSSPSNSNKTPQEFSDAIAIDTSSKK